MFTTRNGHILAAPGIAALLAACSGATVTESIQPVVEFTVQGAAETSDVREPNVTTATADFAVLEGVISTPNPCYSFAASIEAEDSALTVTVTASQQAGMCIQVLGAFLYQARITGLPAGTYPVVMTYQYPGTGWEGQSFNLSLTIPP